MHFLCRFGYNQWRDPMKPSQILQKFCQDLNLSEPVYGRGTVRIGSKTFTGPVELEDKNGRENAKMQLKS